MGVFKPNSLTPLKKAYELKNIAVVDLETNRWLDYDELKDIPAEKLKSRWHGKPIRAFLVCWYDHVTKNEAVFDGKNCMKNFLTFYLTKKNRNKITYAHNGGGFDFNPIYQTLVTEPCFSNYYPQVIHVNGKIMVLRIKDRNKNAWQFRDSMFLMKHSLDKLCVSFDPSTKKLHMPDHETQPYETNKQLWQDYCMNDCKSLAEILTKFSDLIIHQIGGSMGMTTSSTAMRTFRHRFLHQELPTYFEWNNFIRTGYYGGRTEVFNMFAPYRGDPYYLYDVNSMYPSVMHDNIFPVSSPKRVSYKDPWDCSGRCGMMECEVVTPSELDIPVLPYRDEENMGKLIFPLGHWKGVYEFSLIEKALELGYKIRPLRTIEFEGDYLFKEYVDTLYPIKQNSTGALYEIAKVLQNGLYGKFGEHSERQVLITDPDADILGTFPVPYDEMGYTTSTVVRYSAHHLPAIATRVTALAQLKLYKGIEHIKNRGGTVYYTDTDSMVTDTKMNTSNRLGDWGIKTEMTRGVFFAPKAYCYEYTKDGKTRIEQKIKGFSHDFARTLTFEDFQKALPPWNDYSSFEENSMHPSSFKEISTRHLQGFSTVVKTRTIKKGYDKRLVNNDYSTAPLLIMR
jgi:hypothetical protein